MCSATWAANSVFQVACKKCDYGNANFRGFLYDQFWYTEHPEKPGFIQDAWMALESEFSISDPRIDDDFPKLLQARVGVRVWLWQSNDACKHIDIYKDQIRDFRYSMPGDEWVFGVYDWPKHKLIPE